jgi:hypothetical protein
MKRKGAVSVPAGESRDWSVVKFRVSSMQAQLHAIRHALSVDGALANRACPAGRYTKLKHKDRIVMSDTPAEILDHMPLIGRIKRLSFSTKRKANILVNGLGLGLCLQLVDDCGLLQGIRKIDVTELSCDVMRLVLPTYLENPEWRRRLYIHNVDAFKFEPKGGYHAVWHDIWPDINADNLPEMERLEAKYKNRCSWQGCWGKHLCEVMEAL